MGSEYMVLQFNESFDYFTRANHLSINIMEAETLFFLLNNRKIHLSFECV